MNDVFVVLFRGGLIECTTGSDAVAVKLAGRVLSGLEIVTPLQMHRLAAILDRYGRNRDATQLRAEASRLQAAVASEPPRRPGSAPKPSPATEAEKVAGLQIK